MDDWQDIVFANRHVHNRIGHRSQGQGGKSKGAFDVKRTFGTYEIKCPSADKRLSNHGAERVKSTVEICNLNDEGDALIGTISIPSTLHGTVVLAGSRKTMQTAIRRFQANCPSAESAHAADDTTCDDGKLKDVSKGPGDEEHHNEDRGYFEYSEHDDLEVQRVKEFEKNSFRSPKFWLKWQGQMLCPSERETSKSTVTDSGYMVFSGSGCEKFEGTLSCEPLGWKNIKITGWKVAAKHARDIEVRWENGGT